MAVKGYNMVSALIDINIELGFGQCEAIKKGSVVLTYESLRDQVLSAQSCFEEKGVKAGNFVFCILLDEPVSVVAILALIRMGAVPCLVNPEATLDMKEYYFGQSQSVFSVCNKSLPIDDIDYLESLGVDKLLIGDSTFHKDILVMPKMNLGDENRPAFCLFTSGSTGKPKGVVHRHKDLALINPGYVKHVLDLRPGETVHATSRLFFAYGLNSVFFSLLNSCRVILANQRIEVESIIESLCDETVDVFFSVPTVYALILAELGGQRKNLTCRLAISAGEHLPVAIQEKWGETFNQRIIDGVGTTEIMSTFISNTSTNFKLGSTGRLLPGFEAKLCDYSGEPVPLGETGILWIKGETCEDFYLNDAIESEKHFLSGWFKTNDLYYLDEDGYYFYQGRADDLIKSGGVWVYPYKIEEFLMENDLIDDCAVVGLVEETGLRRPVAFVVPGNKNSWDQSVAKSLKSYCRQKLGRWEYPHKMYLVDSIPKTGSGKKNRALLKEKESVRCY
jgi:acyl-coenzyme A synthetase/AMP-(fatty) acid ligase